MASETLWAGRGDKRDYVLGLAEGWDAVEVVRWRGVQALGQPYKLEVTCARRREDGPLELAPMLDRPATLRVATETRWVQQHGIIVGSDEVDRTRTSYLYRFELAPPSYRMTQRVRYRTFVDQTLEDILVALLENRSVPHPMGHGGLARRSDAPAPSTSAPRFDSFDAPREQFRLAIGDTSRLSDAALRRYVVQYGESDHDLLHRLLEEEGLTYFFEHAEDAVVMTIVDQPGQVSPFAREDRRSLRGDGRGTDVSDRETVRSLRRAERLLWGGTTGRDWDPARSQSPRMACALDEVPAEQGKPRSVDPDLFAQDVFPTRDAEVADACLVPATLAVERRAAARSRRVGRSSVRSLEPGLKLTLTDPSGLHDEQGLVITAVTTFATQLLPEDTALDDERWGLGAAPHSSPTYENEFLALPEDIRFRPELSTARPRVHGMHTAVVSADEIQGSPPEIHINESSQVRLRFPWDERIEPGRPSSCWVRVSQAWAGAGYGDVFVPRVGQEVLVAYLAGDPERPLVVGRVYNATQPVPYTKPTVSTLKSKSSPDSDGYNELRFDDEAGNEEVYLQAEKNLNELVKACHSTSVGGDQSNSVGGNQSNSVKGDRDHHVGGSETNGIDAGMTTTIRAFEERTVIGPRTTTVHGQEHTAVLASRTALISGAEKRTVLGPDRVAISGERSVKVLGAHTMSSAELNKLTGPVFHAAGGGATLHASDGVISIDNGAGAAIVLTGNTIILCASSIMALSKGTIRMVAGGPITGTAPTIKLNG